MVKWKISKVLVFGLLALLLAVVPLVGACGPEEVTPTPPEEPEKPAVPEVEKPESVKIGFTQDMHVAYATICTYHLQGMRDSITNINAEGGVDGVPLELEWMDCGQDPALALRAYEKFKRDGVLVMGSISSAHTAGIRGVALEDMFPTVNQAAGTDLYIPADPVLYSYIGAHLTGALPAVKWFDEEWKKQYGDEPWKLGMIYWEHPLCLPSVPCIQYYCDKIGVEVAGLEPVSFRAREFKTELARLKQAGANAILMMAVCPASWMIVRDMDELGMLPGLEVPLDDISGRIWHDGITPLGDQCAVCAIGTEIAGPAAKYMIAVDWGCVEVQDTTGKPGLQAMYDAHVDTYGIPLSPETMGYKEGWMCVEVMAAAISRTVEQMGWEKLTRQAVCEVGLPGLVVDTKGLTGSLSYADYPGDHSGSSSSRLMRFNDEKQTREPLTDFFPIDKYCYDEGIYDVLMAKAGKTEWPTEWGGKTWPKRTVNIEEFEKYIK